MREFGPLRNSREPNRDEKITNGFAVFMVALVIAFVFIVLPISATFSQDKPETLYKAGEVVWPEVTCESAFYTDQIAGAFRRGKMYGDSAFGELRYVVMSLINANVCTDREMEDPYKLLSLRDAIKDTNKGLHTIVFWKAERLRDGAIRYVVFDEQRQKLRVEAM